MSPGGSAQGTTRFEVWGDPIDHSLSPRLHAAAYRTLGWEWAYGRRRVDEASFSDELASLGLTFRGLSLTFPLKGVAWRAAATRDEDAERTGAVNTLLLTDDGPHGFNTDVGGIVADLRAHGIDGIERARIIGAGATAASAMVALGDLGARNVEVIARRPEAAAGLVDIGAAGGVRVALRMMGDIGRDAGAPASVPVTVSTLPGGATPDPDAARALAAGGGLLYDVVYGHWPTALATAWQEAGGTAVDGHGMLVQQAVRQIRIFATGDPAAPLPREDDVVASMVSALVGD